MTGAPPIFIAQCPLVDLFVPNEHTVHRTLCFGEARNPGGTDQLVHGEPPIFIARPPDTCFWKGALAVSTLSLPTMIHSSSGFSTTPEL